MASTKLPLTECRLSQAEAQRIREAIDQFRAIAGQPGDFGYGSRLGIVLGHLYDIADELRKTSPR